MLTSRNSSSGPSGPLREHMLRQTREQDLALTIELSKAPRPATIDEMVHYSAVRLIDQLGLHLDTPNRWDGQMDASPKASTRSTSQSQFAPWCTT